MTFAPLQLLSHVLIVEVDDVSLEMYLASNALVDLFIVLVVLRDVVGGTCHCCGGGKLPVMSECKCE